MKAGPIVGIVASALLLSGGLVALSSEVGGAKERLQTGQTERPKIAIADDAEVAYCTPAFKDVLQRVLHACGLVGGESRRGCQPSDIKSLAAISDEDFNALFHPLKDRGAVVMFDDNSEKLDAQGESLLKELWQDRRGARYFFVVARASNTGGADHNRELSHKRANSVKFLIDDTFKDPDLNQKIGLLWLGEEFAQLGDEYCSWNVSREGKTCKAEDINRSAFVSWVDCQL